MNKIYFIIIIVLTSSCTNKNSEHINLDLSLRSNELNYSVVFDSLKNIQLETNENCLIGKIDQILKDDSLLFILDKHQKSIFIFDDKGKFLRKIYYVGKGDKEYISTTSFCIDTDRKYVYILDDIQQKLFKYNYNTEFISSLNLNREDIVRSMGVLRNGNIVFFTPDYMSRSRDGVWEIDTLGNFVKSFRDVDPKHKFVFIPYPYYSNYNGKISFYDGFKNEIYSIKNKTLKREYCINLSQKMPDKYLINERGTKEGGTGDYYMNRHISETESIYYLQFKSTNKGVTNVFLDKKSKNIFSADKLKNDMDKNGVANKLFNFNRNSLVGIVWDDTGIQNPILQILYVKKQ